MKKADVEPVATALNHAGVKFIVVGGIPVVEHGYGRTTYDIDVVLHLEQDLVRRAFAALAEIGYFPRLPIRAEQFADAEMRRRLIEEKRMEVLNFWSDLHRDTPLHVFVTEPFDFALEYEEAELREVSPGVSVRILKLHTLLQMKRKAARPKDLADVDEVSLLHGLAFELDRAQ